MHSFLASNNLDDQRPTNNGAMQEPSVFVENIKEANNTIITRLTRGGGIRSRKFRGFVFELGECIWVTN